MSSYEWYSLLVKPDWAPPAWIFAPVWTILYILISVSFAVVFYEVYHKKIPKIVALPFVLNLLFNALYTPLEFSLKNNWLASFDIILVLGTLIWGLLAVIRYKRWIAYINIPYMLWVMFATTLQITITLLN